MEAIKEIFVSPLRKKWGLKEIAFANGRANVLPMQIMALSGRQNAYTYPQGIYDMHTPAAMADHWVLPRGTQRLLAGLWTAGGTTVGRTSVFPFTFTAPNYATSI